MATQSDLQRGFKINAAMSAFLRVVVDTSGLVGPATFNQLGIGVLQNDVSSTTYDIAVVRRWGAGTFKMTAPGLSMTAADVVHALTGGYFGIRSVGAVTPNCTIGYLLESVSVPLTNTQSVAEVAMAFGSVV